MPIPTDYTGLVLWLKADAITANDGDALGTWPDSSGLNNHATQSTQARKPIYKTNIINSLPVVRHALTTRVGMVTPVNIALPYTIFLLYSATGTSGVRRALQGEVNNWLMGPRSDWYNSHACHAEGWGNASVAVTPDQFVRFYVTHASSPNTLSVYTNGHLAQPIVRNLPPGVLCTGGAGQYDEPVGGDIAEVIVYSRVLSDVEREAIDSYLATKYAITTPVEAPTDLLGVTPMVGGSPATPVTATNFQMGSGTGGGAGAHGWSY